MGQFHKIVAVSFCVLMVLCAMSEGVPSGSYGNAYGGGSCAAYRRAYIKLRDAVRTCNYANNYACRPTLGSARECDLRCIDISRRCDGTVDCPYGDDETNCPTTTVTTTTTTTGTGTTGTGTTGTGTTGTGTTGTGTTGTGTTTTTTN